MIFLNNENYELVGFAANTRFVTPYGIRSFLNYSNGEEVVVSNAKSQWVTCNVVKIESNAACYNYRYETNIKKVICSNLGLRLCKDVGFPLEKVNTIPKNKEDALFFSYGYAIGLGREIEGYTIVKIKDSLYKETFEKAGLTVGIIEDGSYEFALHGNLVRVLLDSKAYRYTYSEGKYWLVWGLINALSSGNNPGIYTQRRELIDLLEELSCVCGFHVVSSSIVKNGSLDLYYIKLCNGVFSDRTWKVDSIEDKGISTLWGLENKNNDSVVLEGGIIVPSYIKKSGVAA